MSIPMICSLAAFLVVYALVIVLSFRATKWGQRRRWVVLDYVWVPLGLITGAFLIVLAWQGHVHH